MLTVHLMLPCRNFPNIAKCIGFYDLENVENVFCCVGEDYVLQMSNHRQGGQCRGVTKPRLTS